jgi:alpha-L-fucosidase
MSKKTSVTKRQLLKGATALGAVAPAIARTQDAPVPKITPPGALDIAPGPFKGDWQSLAGQYQTPDWFRDAKFGIWAHWSAQCVPEQGDWYARKMYTQGDAMYDHHLKTYGHPADTGFMEIDNLWKAERWNPDELVEFYKKNGAKYFFALANHHDNFDNYDSKFHNWNAVKVGPKKDLIAGWAKAARKAGLKFGVSNHSAHSWHWFQVAYDYDPEGPRQGQRYDAFKLTKADGKGKWWDGLDPQELYVGATYVMPDGITTIKDANAYHQANDRKWDEGMPPVHPEFATSWFLRCKDLLDSYQPDLLYFDNTGLPFGQPGLDVTAHFYNAGLKWHGGKQEVVVFSKGLPPEHLGAVVLDIERGSASEIQPHPWQTDTCLGDWHYNRKIYDEKRYKTAPLVIHTLCNIVSKNGNLLLSVPVRGDGSIDSEERAIVEGIGEWLGRYGDAIYGTRPWRTAGEGPTESVSGNNFGEGKQKAFTPEDIRFTSKKGALYAITLGRPEGETVTIKTLAEGAPFAAGKIKKVVTADSGAPLVFKRDSEGLHITLPAKLSHDIGVAFKITGTGLV